MVCIARANRVAIQKILPTRNLRIGHTQDAGAESAVSPKSKTQRRLDNQHGNNIRQNRNHNQPKQKIKEKELMA